jgi:hypothetical protein
MAEAGNRDQGTENREQGTENREQRTENREQSKAKGCELNAEG